MMVSHKEDKEDKENKDVVSLYSSCSLCETKKLNRNPLMNGAIATKAQLASFSPDSKKLTG